jgi:hypothetical protein
MTQDKPNEQHDQSGQPAPRAATQQRPPERELELKLKKNPHDNNAKVDVGSDESMDASDPVAVTAPGGNEPVPSSTFPEDD